MTGFKLQYCDNSLGEPAILVNGPMQGDAEGRWQGPKSGLAPAAEPAARLSKP
jgi:hypothetical protein